MARASRRKRQPAPPDPVLFELRVHVAEDLAEEVGGWLVASGAGGIVEEPGTRGRSTLVTYGERDALVALATPLSETLGRRVKVEVKPAKTAADWETAFLEHLEPVQISRTLTLVPLRSDGSVARHAGEGELPPAERCVFLGPRVAFGFGEHPTTRMAARAVERYFAKRRGASFLDVGTGSGVLAVVAARAGAGSAVGVDIDVRAVDAAKSNAARNGVGTLCRFSKTPVARLKGAFDLVVANVDRGTLLKLAPALALRVAPTGTLLLTGVLPEDRRDLEAAYGALGFSRTSTKREGSFVLLTLAPSKQGAAKARPGKSRTARRTSRTPRSR